MPGGLTAAHGHQHSWGNGGWGELCQLLLIPFHESSRLTCMHPSKSPLHPPTTDSGTEPQSIAFLGPGHKRGLWVQMDPNPSLRGWSPVTSPSVLPYQIAHGRKPGAHSSHMRHSVGSVFLLVHPQAAVVCQQRCS